MLKLNFEEIELIVEALKSKNGRERERYYQTGLSMKGKRDALEYRDEMVAKDEKMKRRKELAEKLTSITVDFDTEQ